MKTLIICRHAKADYPPNTPDHERPLKERGRKDARKQAERLLEDGFCPDIIVSSSAVRALQTAEIVAKQLEYAADIFIEPSIYEESIENVLQVVKQIPQNLNTAMIFGHNPTMSLVVRTLLAMHRGYEMPTSAMVCIENFQNSWDFSQSRALILRWVMIPRWKRKEEDEN